MRTETGTFELRDDDMMMRELAYAEMSEVVGGEGVASVALPQCFLGSILGSPGLLTVLGSSGLSIVLATSGTSASASISANGASLAAISATGGTVSASAQVS
jgi:hypothetical protein